MPANLTLTQQSDGNYAANLVGDDYTLNVPDATLTVIPYTPPVVAPVDPPVAPPAAPPAQPTPPVSAPVAPPSNPPLVADFKVVRTDGLAVVVQDASKVTGGTIESIAYNFAPKVTSSGRPGAIASVTLPAAGTYTIKQTVRDSNGNVSTATHDITVPA